MQIILHMKKGPLASSAIYQVNGLANTAPLYTQPPNREAPLTGSRKILDLSDVQALKAQGPSPHITNPGTMSFNVPPSTGRPPQRDRRIWMDDVGLDPPIRTQAFRTATARQSGPYYRRPPNNSSVGNTPLSTPGAQRYSFPFHSMDCTHNLSAEDQQTQGQGNLIKAITDFWPGAMAKFHRKMYQRPQPTKNFQR